VEESRLAERCVFCQIIEGRSPASKVYEDEHVLALLDVNPVAEHHTLIIPKRHYRDLYEIPGEELSRLIVAAKKISMRYKTDYGIKGVNILHASGVDAQQSIFHFHLHLIPRKKDDGLDHFIIPKEMII